jgi:hypothetical protein
MEYHVLVTLPLLVLSVPFNFVLPIALTSLLLSASVCVAAAIQAELPKNKKRFWSRPLVALLFFLQPIARGWARYQGRLELQQTPAAARARLENLPSRDESEPLDHQFYWGDGQIDRIDWVNSMVLRLDQQGWPNKADAGWSDHDVEIYGSRWTRLQIITATEDYGGGKRLFRCRLRGYWSLLAKLAFWSFTGFELLVIGIVSRDQPWLWLVLLTMPVFAWFLQGEKRNQQRLLAAFLDDLAKQRGLTKLKFEPKDEKFVPAAS